jgi:enediyne biosynthesis protein E4
MHALYRNMFKSDRALFLFATPAAGIAAIGQKYVGWGTGFIDVDHHGWEDLFIANGHAIRYPTGTTRSQKPVLLRNQEGRFKDITVRGGPYFQKPHLSRGVALGDLDNDGKVDAVISHLNEPVTILRNVSPAGNNWVGVQLVGKDHADVVGARVIVEAGGRKQTRFAKGGGSYASSPDRRLVFGLAKTEKIDRISVFWPNGQTQEWSSLPINRYHLITQGDREPREVLPKK